MAFLGQAYFRAKYFAQALLHGAIDAAITTATGSGGSNKKHRRKRVLKRTVYGTVVSVWQEEYNESPPAKLAEQITDDAFDAVKDRDLDAEIAAIEIRALVVRLMAQIVQDEEDEETALFAML